VLAELKIILNIKCLISVIKIKQVIQQENLICKKIKKRERPKYICYKADNINDQWHIDWSINFLSKKRG